MYGYIDSRAAESAGVGLSAIELARESWTSLDIVCGISAEEGGGGGCMGVDSDAWRQL